MEKHKQELTNLDDKLSEVLISKQEGGVNAFQLGEEPKQERINIAYLGPEIGQDEAYFNM